MFLFCCNDFAIVQMQSTGSCILNACPWIVDFPYNCELYGILNRMFLLLERYFYNCIYTASVSSTFGVIHFHFSTFIVFSFVHSLAHTHTHTHNYTQYVSSSFKLHFTFNFMCSIAPPILFELCALLWMNQHLYGGWVCCRTNNTSMYKSLHSIFSFLYNICMCNRMFFLFFCFGLSTHLNRNAMAKCTIAKIDILYENRLLHIDFRNPL